MQQPWLGLFLSTLECMLHLALFLWNYANSLCRNFCHFNKYCTGKTICQAYSNHSQEERARAVRSVTRQSNWRLVEETRIHFCFRKSYWRYTS